MQDDQGCKQKSCYGKAMWGGAAGLQESVQVNRLIRGCGFSIPAALCTGQWERALANFSFPGELDPINLAMVQTYRRRFAVSCSGKRCSAVKNRR